MNRTKIQKLLNKLDGRSEATFKVIADFDAGAKALRDKLEKDLTATTLDEVNKKINQLRKSVDINPLLEATQTLKDEFRQHALSTLKEIEDKSAELRRTIDEGNRTINDKTDIIAKNVAMVNEGLKKVSGETSTQIKQIVENVGQISSKLPNFADRKIVEDKLKILEDRDNTEELKDYTDKTRIELMSLLAQKGGGNANRNIAIGGNYSVLSQFTDLNLKPGNNVTFTIVKNQTTKYTELTIAATGGGGSVGGTVRQITTLSVSSTIGSLSGTDQVYLCAQGIQVVLPTPTGDTNLYTIKNVSNSSIIVVGTIDNDAGGIIMPVKYTSVDIISNDTDWNIT